MNEAKANILLIEPDISFAEKLTAFLMQSGHEISSAESASHAEKLIDQVDWASEKSSVNEALAPIPDVVIVELGIWGGSGIDVLKHVKALSPHTVVLLLASDGSARDVVDALRKGVDDFLVKPLDECAVVEKVMLRALRRAKLEAEHAQAQRDLRRLNAELKESMHALERDQAAGRMVQERLLAPRLAEFNDINVSFDIIPSFYLSGDSIDYGFVASRYLAFYLTDVSGHGAASAFVTVWVKQLVRGFFREHNVFRDTNSFNSDIPRLMKMLNESLMNADIGPHLTCFVGVIDTEALEMNYVVGGHLPLPVLQQGNDYQCLDGKGKPLGIFEDAEWEISKVKLEPEFNLMIFSDGVLELFEGSDLSEKEAALTEFAVQHRSTELNHLQDQLPLQNRDTLPDDVAMLLITRSGHRGL